MPASVTVHHKAFGDDRITRFAELAGYSRYEALGRLVALWSVCTELQTKGVVTRLRVRACLGARGDEFLVESDLAETIDSGDVRVRGCHDRHDWYGAQPSQQREAGRKRAAGAQRDARGRLIRAGAPLDTSDTSAPPADRPPLPHPIPKPLVALDASAGGAGSSGPANDQRSPALDPDLDLPEDRERDQAPPPPEPSGSGTIARVEREAPRPAAAPTPREAVLRALWNDAWSFAGLEFTRLRSEGIDPNAHNSWHLPAPKSFEATELAKRVDESLIVAKGDPAAAFARIKNRVLVASAKARHKFKHLHYFTPPRMWDAKWFGEDVALTPDQVADSAAAARAGPGARTKPAEPPRLIADLTKRP